MSPLLWISVVFALLLLVFLTVAFFKAPSLTPDQRTILRIFSALCGGISGALLAGEALFALTGDVGQGLSLTVQGTAGFAIFFAVWFFFPKPPERALVPDAFHFSVPAGWTLHRAADVIAKEDHAFVDCNGLDVTVRDAPLQQREVDVRDAAEAIEKLQYMTVHPVRPYRVARENGVYRLYHA